MFKVDTDKMTVFVDKMSTQLTNTSEAVKTKNVTLKFATLEDVFKRATGISGKVAIQQRWRSKFISKTTTGTDYDFIGFKAYVESLSNTVVDVPAVGERTASTKETTREKVYSAKEMFPGISNDDLVEMMLVQGTDEEVEFRAALCKKYPKKA